MEKGEIKQNELNTNGDIVRKRNEDNRELNQFERIQIRKIVKKVLI